VNGPQRQTQPRLEATAEALATNQKITDEQLLETDTPESFTALYRRHVRRILGHLVRLTADPDLAADLMAETFADALVSRTKFDPSRGSAEAWLFGIAHNKLAEYRRRGHAELRALRRLGIERVEATDADRVDILYLAGVAAVELIEELTDDQQRIVRARVLEDRPYSEIAGQLDLSEQVVRKRLSRGLAVLRKRLKGVR
jgi:RNA polymerase sigma-70 factor (ECF subfamily)